jgi:hypothetical protein
MIWSATLAVLGFAMAAACGSGGGWLAAVTALAFFWLASEVKCTRCRRHVFSIHPLRFAFALPKSTCERCGQKRRWILPFQYRLKAEASPTTERRF